MPTDSYYYYDSACIYSFNNNSNLCRKKTHILIYSQYKQRKGYKVECVAARIAALRKSGLNFSARQGICCGIYIFCYSYILCHIL